MCFGMIPSLCEGGNLFHGVVQLILTARLQNRCTKRLAKKWMLQCHINRCIFVIAGSSSFHISSTHIPVLKTVFMCAMGPHLTLLITISNGN